MKTISLFIFVLLYVPVWEQINRKPEIEKFTGKIYSAKEFRQVADSLQLSIDELSYYTCNFSDQKTAAYFIGLRVALASGLQGAEISYGY